MLNDMPQLSIIIPIYNVSAYLPKCLDSVAKQLEDDWELILVNDGSTDESGNISEEFARLRPNVHVLNKSNGGLSDARNAGTEIAKGEWIFYLDSDDWLAKDAVHTLLDFAIIHNCDVVQGGLYYAYDDYLLYDSRVYDRNILDNLEAMRSLIINDRVKNFAWGKLYRSSIVKDIPFPKGRFFEDSFWQHLVMYRVQRYGVISEPLYYYRQRKSSISGDFSLRNLDLIKGYEERLRFICDSYPELKDLMVGSYWRILFSFTSQSRSSSNYLVRKKFEEYYKYAISRYYHIFVKSLKNELSWKFREKPRLLSLFLFLKRCRKHLFAPKYYKTIKLDERGI